MSQAEELLHWYAEKAEAMARYANAKPPQTDAMMAVVTELCLDAGNRARAYLNEKPHEPPPGMTKRMDDWYWKSTQPDASPPHAEPVGQPLLPCPFCGATPILHDAVPPPSDHQPVECPTKDCVMSRAWPDIHAWQKRAAPSAQPIAPPRGPTQLMIQAAIDEDLKRAKTHQPVTDYGGLWRAMYDAAVKP